MTKAGPQLFYLGTSIEVKKKAPEAMLSADEDGTYGAGSVPLVYCLQIIAKEKEGNLYGHKILYWKQ